MKKNLPINAILFLVYTYTPLSFQPLYMLFYYLHFYKKKPPLFSKNIFIIKKPHPVNLVDPVKK